MLSGEKRARAFYQNWKREAKGFEKVWKSGFCIDYDQPLFSLALSSRTRETCKWPRARLKARDERGTKKRLNLKNRETAPNLVAAGCVNTDLWLGEITREWRHTWGLRHCKTGLPWAGKTLNMVQGPGVPPEWRIENSRSQSFQGQTKIVVLFVAEHHG